ncbi:MAG: DUF3298 domain-containing protein [Oscillospiraceae bacterium]|nr:DUF3298 domain-containing protein [Oscillospiraceae bacterium]
MRTSIRKRAYTVVVLLLCLALLCGCAAKAASTAEPTASPTPPSTVPDSPAPAAPTDPPAEKNGMYDLLTRVFDDYHQGTAGSSLKAAFLAATMVDWAAENGRDAVLAGARAWDRGLETEFGESFEEKLSAVRESALSIARGGTGVLADCGYEGSWDHSEREVNDTFDALSAGLGLNAPEDSGAPTQNGPVVLNVETERETFYSEQVPDREILSFACSRPFVTVSGNESAEQAINAALEADWRDFVIGPDEPQEGLTAGRDNFLKAAEEELQMRTADGYADSFAPFACERSLDLRRGDASILSLTYSDYTFMDGAHGYTLHTGHVFDTRSGAELHLEDLGVEGTEFLPTLEELLLRVAESAEYGVYNYWDDYRELLPTLLRDGNWYLSEDGLVVLSNPYELESYAAGLIEFIIPYEWMKLDMKEEYLPADTLPEGELSGEILDQAGESKYLLDDGTGGAGAAVTFTARGDLENVRIQRVYYSEYSETFWPADLFWYASSLSDGETLTLLTWIPDAAPNLSISYDGIHGRECCYISQSGKDGSLVLLPADDSDRLPLDISAMLPLSYDLDGDGVRETIELRNTEENGAHRWELMIDGSVLPTGSYASDAEVLKVWLTDLDYDGKAEIFVTGDMGSDDYVTCGWNCDTLGPITFAGDNRADRTGEDTDTADGELCFSVGQPVLRSWIYQMGTYDAFRLYTMEEGRMIPAPYSQWVYRSNTFALETVRELPVIWDNGEEGSLPAGSSLTLCGCDGGLTRFVTSDGTGGAIRLEYRQDGMDSGWFINGVSENQYFATLPYAG